MSGFLNQTCTINHYATTINDSGTTDFSIDSQDSGVPCNFQPDTSGEVIIGGQQLGAGGGKLFLPASQTIDNDDKVVIAGDLYRVAGPPVLASGASAKWVPVNREVP